MSRAQRRHPAYREAAKTANESRPAVLTPIPQSKWPASTVPVIEVWCSRTFLVVIYSDPCGYQRMTVNRTTIDKNGRWNEQITWEELMQCKREIGRAEQWAVELFPSDSQVVNVANMRHLWILDGPPEFGWTRG